MEQVWRAREQVAHAWIAHWFDGSLVPSFPMCVNLRPESAEQSAYPVKIDLTVVQAPDSALLSSIAGDPSGNSGQHPIPTVGDVLLHRIDNFDSLRLPGRAVVALYFAAQGDEREFCLLPSRCCDGHRWIATSRIHPAAEADVVAAFQERPEPLEWRFAEGPPPGNFDGLVKSDFDVCQPVLPRAEFDGSVVGPGCPLSSTRW